MQFNSLEFIVFLPIVFAIYWSLNNRRHQNVLVLAASYLFYGWWEWRFLLLIAITTACSFSSGLLIQRFCSVRKWICGVNVVLNLAILAVFKYFDFFADNLHALATVLGWHIDAPTLNIVLPVGISFYTFQALSYAIDVYRGRISPTREVVDFFATAGGGAHRASHRTIAAVSAPASFRSRPSNRWCVADAVGSIQEDGHCRQLCTAGRCHLGSPTRNGQWMASHGGVAFCFSDLWRLLRI